MFVKPTTALSRIDFGRQERHVGLQCDPSRTRARPRLVLLDEALLPARPLREHDDHVALTGQPDRGLDRLAVAQAASHLERSGTVEREPERPPVELGLRHEAEPADGPERHPEGPWIEAREVV